MKADNFDRNEKAAENEILPDDEIETEGVAEQDIEDADPAIPVEGVIVDELEPDGDSGAQELAAERERYTRLYAEYENFRKRSARERETVYTDIRADTILQFLPVYDNLSRALTQECTDEAYKRGIEMIMAQLLETLEKFGVVGIPSVGEQFDPELHNAVMHVEDESVDDGVIVEEFMRGFKLGNKVIRFSMVKVAN